jgi:hypothetical protein
MMYRTRLFQVCLTAALAIALGCFQIEPDTTGSSVDEFLTTAEDQLSDLVCLLDACRPECLDRLGQYEELPPQCVFDVMCGKAPCREECLDPIGTENVPEICGATCEDYPCQPICGIPNPDVCRVAHIAGL